MLPAVPMPQLLPPVEHHSFADIMEPDEDEEEDLDVEGEVSAREPGIEDDPDDDEEQRNMADKFAGNTKRLGNFKPFEF